MYYRKINALVLFILIHLWCSIHCMAQSDFILPDSVYAIEEIAVKGDRFYSQQNNASNLDIDSLVLLRENSSSIANTLRYNTFIYIKDYGPGNISTTSARGGSAVQTQTFWNGININQSGLGMVDMSTIPAFLIDHATVQQSPSGAGFGSGAVSGNVLLSNNNKGNPGAYALLKQTFSSIEESNTGLRLGYNASKWNIDLRTVRIASQNRYQYAIPRRDGEEYKTQEHAAFLQQGLSLSSQAHLSKYSKLSLYGWYTDFDRFIAPSIYATNKAKQIDRSLKTSVQWEYAKNKVASYYKGSYLNDFFDYKQGTFIHSIINSNTFSNEWEQHYTHSKQLRFNVGVTQLFQSVRTVNYENGEKNRWRWAIFGGLQWKDKKEHTLIVLSLREEHYASLWAPLVYSLNVKQKVFQNTHLSIKGDKHYRIPSMHDLYWYPGGNSKLKPEQGWNVDAFLTHHLNKGSIRNTFSAGVFSRWIDDWIIWLPENGLWTPNNINKVWSRGIEVKNDMTFNFSDQSFFQLNWRHTYQKSTKENPSFEGDESYQKQLIYVPLYIGNVGCTIQYKKVYLSYQHQYTSWVFIYSDESDFIDPYHTAMLRGGVQLFQQKNRVELFAEVDNCWNASYQTVKDRPMPLRYYRAGLIYKWN